MLLLTSFLSAMFAAIILIPPLTALYRKLNIVDLPSERKVHTDPIPRVGGVAIVGELKRKYFELKKEGK